MQAWNICRTVLLFGNVKLKIQIITNYFWQLDLEVIHVWKIFFLIVSAEEVSLRYKLFQIIQRCIINSKGRVVLEVDIETTSFLTLNMSFQFENNLITMIFPIEHFNTSVLILFTNKWIQSNIVQFFFLNLPIN